MKVDYDHTKEVTKEVGSDNSSVLPSPVSLAVIESLTMPLVQEVVMSADMSCTECQKRISNVISRSDAEMESVVVNLLEKKVVVTFKYLRVPTTQITTRRPNFFSKVALIKRIFGSSRPKTFLSDPCINTIQ